MSVDASPQTLFGFSPDLLVGQSVDLFVDVFRHALPPGLASGFNRQPEEGGSATAAARSRTINAMLVKLAEK